MARQGKTVRIGTRRRGLPESTDWARARLSRCLQLAYPLQPVPQHFDDLAFAIENEEIARLLGEIADLENERLDRMSRVLSRHHGNDN
ncbi:hypothetical protein OLX02_01970 [Novosphingobium sp. KCTC 2891]|uniref:hypothetical protein n=1 Tax=Novosphingobium sp. KCTC 2891 TaxID=2989730 RepID=UPI0022226DBC|nr:hypothetical protein [Novosphingobium sp. KCTC 2891]MCW1381580.1 hypothetical protein [Novosphingobium sp. KCTC 2891]